MAPGRSLFVDVATASRLELGPAAIREIEQRVNGDAATNRRLALTVIAGVIVMIVAGSIIGAGLVRLTLLLGLARWLGYAIAAIVTAAALVGLWMLIFPRIMRRPIRNALRACGYNICVACGYRLDGLPARAPCPECGRREQPPLGERRPTFAEP